MNSEIARLQERIEELEYALGVTVLAPQARPPIRWQSWKLLGMLIARPQVTHDAGLIGVFGDDTDRSITNVHVYMVDVRRLLRRHEIKLCKIWGVGWYLTPDDRKKAATLFPLASEPRRRQVAA